MCSCHFIPECCVMFSGVKLRPVMEEKLYDFIHKLMTEAAESKGLKQSIATDLLSSTKDLPKHQCLDTKS